MIPELELDRKTETGSKLLVQTLPQIERGINLVEADPDLPVFQILLSRELSSGKAFWIDQGDQASTFRMSRVGGENFLRDIMVSRSYTPYQHYTSVMEAEEFLEDAEVMVMPSINLMYEDQLKEKEREDLFGEMMQRIDRYAAEYGLKVLTSLSDRVPGSLEFRIRARAEKTVEAEKTCQGLKFESEGFSSQIYRSNGKIQTTVPLFTNSTFKGEVEIVGKNEQDLQAAPGAVL